jgi:hypothetical protein
MNVEMFSLCDAATDTAGKLNILGAFDSIVVGAFPAVHPQCAIALRIRFMRVEEGDHAARISLIDADGHSIVPDLDAKLNIKFGGPETSVAANLIMNLQRLQFKKPGEYSIELTVDNKHEKSLPVVVRMRGSKNN